MSDSEDDFMSDKFLVDVAQETTYSSRRAKAELQGMRRGQAHNARVLPRKQEEEVRRRAGLNKSLFDDDDEEESRGGIGSASGSSSKPAAPKKDAGQAKAMDFMKKMGWSVGESLGRRRSASPERKKARTDEPLRISMWAGRKGLTARSPSPPPLPKRLNPDEITPEAHARLETKATTFRGQVGADFTQRDMERKAYKAREILVDLDAKKGIKFHPLHADPANPEALPRPLLIRIYPELDTTRSRSASPVLAATPAPPAPSATAIAASARNLSAAEKPREQMRRDMLADLGGAEEEEVRFGIPAAEKIEGLKEEKKDDMPDAEEPDWEELVSGTKRVLSMKPEDNLAFLVSQLRHEHLFCFWCGSKYSSWAEMDGPGGCPGETEDDH